jgi:V8-like Glu-specific endopeptidase
MGPCAGDSASIAGSQENVLTTATVTMKEMNRFKSENFKLVTVRDTKKFGRPSDKNYKDKGTAQEEATDVLRVRRMTKTGHEYAATLKFEDYSSNEKEAKANPGDNDLHLRSLVVIGADARSKIQNTTVFPYSAIAEVDFDQVFQGGCTATMISRNTALTAGHCVYSFGDQDWNSVTQIAPGRYRNATDPTATVNPFGIWYVNYISTFEAWTQKRERAYDIGVIRLDPRTNEEGCPHYYPGDAVGFAGFSKAVVEDSRLATATITGYPADKNDGGQWRSGSCEWNHVEPRFSYHYCDTYGGMTGSAVLTADNEVLGEHSIGFTDPTNDNIGVYNGAVLLEGPMYDAIYDFSERALDLPSCILDEEEEDEEDEGDCSCTSGGFFCNFACK